MALVPLALPHLASFYRMDLQISLFCDSKGIIFASREDLNERKERIARRVNLRRT
jgi:hypothetical protein